MVVDERGFELGEGLVVLLLLLHHRVAVANHDLKVNGLVCDRRHLVAEAERVLLVPARKQQEASENANPAA